MFITVKRYMERAKNRFEKKFVKRDSGCWEWTASLIGGGSEGYGQFGFKGKNQCAHRISWELYREPIPPGMNILHKCHNKKCVNPEHLYVGTQYDNVTDSYTPNRRPHTKLKECDVICIKKMLRDRIPQWLIGLAYGIKQGTVSHINTGVTWFAVSI